MTIFELRVTDLKVPFLDLGIGSLFFAHKKLWVRTTWNVATTLVSTTNRCASACDFLIDGTVKSVRHPDLCEEVTVVEIIER